jgi:hypothetical protein
LICFVFPIVCRVAWAGGAVYNPSRRHDGAAGAPPL